MTYQPLEIIWLQILLWIEIHNIINLIKKENVHPNPVDRYI